jgi:pyruvate/2-oxoglutarate dehydrogenase complex dihydrolipoamide acyltransferase (E2) component
MRHEVKLPAFAEGMTEAFVAQWLVPVGAGVAVGDELVEVITDKVNVTIPADVAGQLVEHCAGEEERVAVGEPLAIIDVFGT